MFSRFGKFIALLLLALWLPVTQHCGLEAAGLFATENECHDEACCSEPHEKNSCDTDSCQAVEDSLYKSDFGSLTLAEPSLTVLTCLRCLQAISTETMIVTLISPAQTDAPPELIPTWQFTTRAAPSPRAPSTLV